MFVPSGDHPAKPKSTLENVDVWMIEQLDSLATSTTSIEPPTAS
ncbi:MAG: hypothetical protein ABSB24_13510 [Gaiellaceae bacterium]|jgi:hypothetical protein